MFMGHIRYLRSAYLSSGSKLRNEISAFPRLVYCRTVTGTCTVLLGVLEYNAHGTLYYQIKITNIDFL
jgi:hypothetical protein